MDMLDAGVSQKYLKSRTPKASRGTLGTRKPSIQVYAELLRDQGVLGKQDMKDVAAWSGLRDHAAHGEWDEVKDRDRIRLMLEGVNLFLRKHGT